MNTKVESLKEQQKGFAKVIRQNCGTIATNLIEKGEFWNDEITSKLIQAAQHHVTMFEGIFREELKNAMLPTPDAEVTIPYIVENIQRALLIFDRGEVLFTPTGKVKEGETLDYRLFALK